MTNRTASHTKTVLAAALTAAVLAGLSACGSDKPSAAANGANPAAGISTPAVGAPSTNQSNPSNPSNASTPSQPSAATPTNSTTASQNQPPATPKPTTKPTPAKTTKPTSTLPTDCTATQLKATVTALTRPNNHVLLTVTNTGKTPCNLYYYPALRFDSDQQSVTPAIEDSKPQSVVTITPGASAYAAIGTSAADGSGGAGKVEKQVEVFLETKDQSGSLPGSLTLPLPANTYVDDKAFVTYWQSDLQSAIAW
ncbi:MAG: DUF4232 domain-containing protein [Catenulisporales bacterium]|nr:DUF4232 domain-containing protein [Catenulisporales bacterium]